MPVSVPKIRHNSRPVPVTKTSSLSILLCIRTSLPQICEPHMHASM